MSQRFMSTGETVGYDFSEKELVVTVNEKIADKMRADGWEVSHDPDLGHFVRVKIEA